MKIEIDDGLIERVKNVLGGDISQEALEGTIAKLLSGTVESDEKKLRTVGEDSGGAEKLIIELTNLGSGTRRAIKRDLKVLVEDYGYRKMISGCIQVREEE